MKMKFRLLLLLAAGLLTMWLTQGAGAQTREQRLTEYVYYFASDSLKGREAGSPGAEMARYYIVARYKECGLKPFHNGDFVIPFEKNGKEYANVVGVIEGTTLKDEYIVVGAHFDHLGVKNGEIYPGADDNASGSAAVIELARELSSRRDELQRSVIIAAFDAEEKGLYGSTALAEFLDTVIGIENVKLMVSVDMVGWYRESGKLILEGTSTIKNGADIARNAAKLNSINIETKGFETSVFTATDTDGFARKHVPTLAVTTGLKSPYHKPGDKAELIDYRGLDKIVDFLSDFTLTVASDPAFAASGKVAPKHEDRTKPFEIGMMVAGGSTSMRFPDAKVTSDAASGYSAGLVWRINFKQIGLQFNTLYEHQVSTFPSLDTSLGKAQKYSQNCITVPAYVIMRGSDASASAYIGMGGYYSYALRYEFSKTDPGVTVNPHQGGVAAVFGTQVGPVMLEWSFRWQLNSLFTDWNKARLHYGSYITLGWVF